MSSGFHALKIAEVRREIDDVMGLLAEGHAGVLDDMLLVRGEK